MLCGAASSRAQVKPDIIERGKKATALVGLSNASGWTGTAFCVDKSGLFLTNAHVVQKATKEAGTITLVLDIGQDTQRSLRARVLRYDDVLDLALLQVVNLPTAGELKKGATVVLRSLTKPKEDLVFTPLELGKDANLVELADVTTFGYPFTQATVAGRVRLSGRDRPGEPHLVASQGPRQAAGNPDRQPAQPRQRGRTGARRLGQGDRPRDGDRARRRDEPGDPGGAAGRLPGRARDRLQSTPVVPKTTARRSVTWTIRMAPPIPGAKIPEGLSVAVTLKPGTDEPRTFTAEPAGPAAFKLTCDPLPKDPPRGVELIARFGTQGPTLRIERRGP